MDLFQGYNPATFPPLGVFLIYVWSLVWKGLALWRSVKQEQKNWFIALLVIQTAGILDIVYLFFFAKEKLTLAQLKGLVTKFNQ